MSEIPCTSCGQRLPIAKPQETFELSFQASTTGVITKRGRKESIMQPLIASFGKPTGGWGVNVKIKGIPQKISANSAMQSFSKLKRLLSSNGLQVSDANIWFNLNLQWYPRTQEKHQLVKYADLLAIAVPIDKNLSGVDPSARNYTPAQWGAKAWDFMGTYLATDEYSWSEFFKVLEIVQFMLNNDTNPSIGCNECYAEFTKQIETLRDGPLHTVEDARLWLTSFHNSVNKRLGKPVFNIEYASKRYLWI